MHNPQWLFTLNVGAHWVASMSSIVSFTLGIVELVRNKKTESWIFFAIAGLFLIMAFDQAWQDEHRNAGVLISEKRDAVEQREFWKNQSYLKDASLRTQNELLGKNYGVLAQTQSSLATLSNRLLDISKPAPLKVTTFITNLPMANGLNQHVAAVILLVNRTISIRGDLQCDLPFTVAEWRPMQPPHEQIFTSSGISTQNLAPNRVHLIMQSPPWEPGVPILVLIVSKEAVSDCEFRL